MRQPLGGQSQKEAADEPAGQDDVPLYEICGLRRRDEGKVKSEVTNKTDPSTSKRLIWFALSLQCHSY